MSRHKYFMSMFSAVHIMTIRGSRKARTSLSISRATWFSRRQLHRRSILKNAVIYYALILSCIRSREKRQLLKAWLIQKRYCYVILNDEHFKDICLFLLLFSTGNRRGHPEESNLAPNPQFMNTSNCFQNQRYNVSFLWGDTETFTVFRKVKYERGALDVGHRVLSLVQWFTAGSYLHKRKLFQLGILL